MNPSRARRGPGIRLPCLRLRRWLFLGLIAATTLAGTGMMLDIVRDRGVTHLELIILALFGATFGWIAIAFWNAVVGFVLMACRRDPLSLERVRGVAHAEAPIGSRTALVMPVHDEDPDRVMRGLAAMLRSLAATGESGRFDLHLLSDTTDDAIARAEASAWDELCGQAGDAVRLYYRRRSRNVGRKAGNIEEFCRRAGARYDFMIVLDADSIMSGTAMVELVRVMEANPAAGLIQTLPIPAGRTSLFGRLVQFAAALYGPMLAAGQSVWQGDAANYWGHNAIVRAEAFDAYCSLPVLSGRPPLGGRILSHDFVEAALLRRAGWGVYLLPRIGGSYEEVPGNIPDYATRDRRWAQGSLQHLRLLGAPGLHPLGRLHFLLGAMGYVSSLLWLLMLLASTAYVMVPELAGGWLADDGFLLMADRAMLWNLTTAGRRLIPLLAATAVLLFVPKALGLALGLARRRQAFGGAARLLASALIELLFAVVVAPVMMLFHSRFVLSVFAGRDIRWAAQARAGRTVTWREAWRRMASAMLVGVIWSGVTLAYSPAFFPWLIPIVTGLLLAVPIARWTSSQSLGRRARDWGLFLVPTETDPPRELREAGEPGSPGRLPGTRGERAPSLAPRSEAVAP